ncbi:MAG TPA: GNAT family protein [Brevefilum sp.]|nr:GNAT family protein [Brevefilum sp.]
MDIYLRAIEPDDYLVSQKWRNDFDLIKGYTAPRFVSLETERKWVQKVIEENESGRSVRVGICTVGEGRLIGYANLLNIDYRNRNCEFSIIIGDRDYHGKGIPAQVRIILFRHAFLNLGMERISAFVLSTNTAAIIEGERFGYVKEGVLRKAELQDGQLIDVNIYSMLKEEFMERYGQSERK